MPDPPSGCSILVDARALDVSGIGRYLREVLQGLLADPRFNRIVLLGEIDALRAFAREHRGDARVEVHPYTCEFYTPRVQIEWLKLNRSGRTQADVSFFPHYDAPFWRLPPRSVVTVQDLTHFKVPELFPAHKRVLAGVLLDRVVSCATRVLVSSESTRQDLVERVPETAGKTTVIPLGVNPFFHTEEGEQTGRDPVIAGGPYLLCVGNRKPHKNHAAAIEVLALLREEMPQLRMVFAGRTYAGWESVKRRAAELDVDGAIVELDDVSDQLLRRLYANCEALLFPSLYEGFGLPVLEAMAAGAPVIASNRASIPEVVGNAGVVVDPQDPAAMAEAVRRVLGDGAFRDELIRLGRERAAEFTWERAVGRTLDVLYSTAHAAPSGVGQRRDIRELQPVASSEDR